MWRALFRILRMLPVRLPLLAVAAMVLALSGCSKEEEKGPLDVLAIQAWIAGTFLGVIHLLFPMFNLSYLYLFMNMRN